MTWHVLETLRGRETVAKWHLKTCDVRYNVFLPMFKAWPHHPAVAMFPQYMFIELDDGHHAPYRDLVHGVVGMVRLGGDSPNRVPDLVIEQLKAKAQGPDCVIVLNDPTAVKKGQKIEVIGGQYVDKIGLCQRVAEDRVTALLDFVFGRVKVDVPIEYIRALG